MKLTASIFATLLVVALGATSCIINVNDDPSGSCRYTLTANSYTGVACMDKKKSEGCPLLTYNTNDHNVLRSGVTPTEASGTFNDSTCTVGGYSTQCATGTSGYSLNKIYSSSGADCAAFID